MKKKPIVLGISGLALAIAVIFLVLDFREHLARSKLRESKYPFASVVIVAIADGEDALRATKLIPPPAPGGPGRVACDLQLCGGVRESSIAKDGTVSIVLNGSRVALFDGKSIVLFPTISNGAVTWKCRTNVPPELVADKDQLPDNVESCLSIS